jgi:hypothetical protein
MDHLSLDELNARLRAAAKQAVVGGTYAHYKRADKTYTVTGLAIIEATNEVAVIYRADYAPELSFVRPLAVWLETVEWQGGQVPRFRFVGDD